jgi:hypothetical protein
MMIEKAECFSDWWAEVRMSVIAVLERLVLKVVTMMGWFLFSLRMRLTSN